MLSIGRRRCLFGERVLFYFFTHRFLFLLSFHRYFLSCVWSSRYVCSLILFPPVGFLDFLRRDTQKAIEWCGGDKGEECMRVWVSVKMKGAICGVLFVLFHVFITEFKFDGNPPGLLLAT